GAELRRLAVLPRPAPRAAAAACRGPRPRRTPARAQVPGRRRDDGAVPPLRVPARDAGAAPRPLRLPAAPHRVARSDSRRCREGARPGRARDRARLRGARRRRAAARPARRQSRGLRAPAVRRARVTSARSTALQVAAAIAIVALVAALYWPVLGY